jgi:hypothetical protein
MGLKKMNKLDDGLKIYLSILLASWVTIIIYLVNYENQNHIQEEFIKKELDSYPTNHSQISDSTLNAR